MLILKLKISILLYFNLCKINKARVDLKLICGFWGVDVNQPQIMSSINHLLLIFTFVFFFFCPFFLFFL